MTVLPAVADGISVMSFKLLETDLTANTHGTQKFDQNGDKAALIKIVRRGSSSTVDRLVSLVLRRNLAKSGFMYRHVPRSLPLPTRCSVCCATTIILYQCRADVPTRCCSTSVSVVM